MGLFDGKLAADWWRYKNPTHFEPEHEGAPLDPEAQAMQFRAGAATQRTPVPWQPGCVMPSDNYVLRAVFNKDVTSKARRERMATRRAERRAARRSIGRHGCSK